MVAEKMKLERKNSQGIPRTSESQVMVDSGASVNVRPKWFVNSKLQQCDDTICLRGANGKPLQEHGK